jgi:hypothetical protein
MCLTCNCYKSNKDEELARVKIQTRKFALKMNLPMTITNEKTYHVLRDGITGGLANVGHRYNFAGETMINKFRIEVVGGEKRVISYDTPNLMTHICGCDFSSLYPSVCSSNPHPFIPYTGHKMWMPGYEKWFMDSENSTQQERMKVIMTEHRFECDNERIIDGLPWFVAVVKGHIDEDHLNDFINFPPIIKKLEVKTSKKCHWGLYV